MAFDETFNESDTPIDDGIVSANEPPVKEESENVKQELPTDDNEFISEKSSTETSEKNILSENEHEEDASLEAAVEEQISKAKSLSLGGLEAKLVSYAETAEEEASGPRDTKRTYKNGDPPIKKPSFGKPTEAKDGKLTLKKVIIFFIICLGIGVFITLQANSYYNYKGGKVSNVFDCLYAWLMTGDMPFKPFPLNENVTMFGMLIGTGLPLVIGVFAHLSNDEKNQSRVGHEHGNARLATPDDYKAYSNRFMEQNDNNMLFGVYKGKSVGLSLNNKLVNRSANVLVIGGTGTGKTFKYIKPNILQENCSMIITDPSGDIFRSFAPYLLSKGYNVYLFNASDFTFSNHYNPLLNVYNSYGEIDETQVDILVDLYMKNAKAGKEAGGGDPFWDKSEKSFLTALIYYTLEEDENLLLGGFYCKDVNGRDIPDPNDKSKVFKVQGMSGGRSFNTILKLVQEAKVSDDDDVKSTLTIRLEDFFRRRDEARIPFKTRDYYATFQIAPQKTANTILITTAVDLQIFATKEVANITQQSEIEELNIDINKIATQQSYLFLGIPQSHQAYNFLIAMLYSQLYGRLYELGERKLRGKYHIGYTAGTPVFDYFDTKEEAQEFYDTITKDDIYSTPYINDQVMWHIGFRGKKSYKTAVRREVLEKLIDDIHDGKMYIWNGDLVAGGDPSLPIHVNFLLDEFKNIGEIPNFLTILSTSRKYRIGSHVVIQDIGQLKTMYKEGEHETVMANVDTTIFLGSILKEDKEEIQKMLGKTTIRQKSTSSSQSGLSTSYTPTEVDLVSIDEISAINQRGRDDEFVIVRDTMPFMCRKLNLTEHKRWKEVKEAPKINLEDFYRNTKKKEKEG